jgi:hypothetical protein
MFAHSISILPVQEWKGKNQKPHYGGPESRRRAKEGVLCRVIEPRVSDVIDLEEIMISPEKLPDTDHQIPLLLFLRASVLKLLVFAGLPIEYPCGRPQARRPDS